MVGCGPAFVVPSFASSPTIGFGLSRLGNYGNRGHSGFGYGSFCFGGDALAESANSLGILSGVRPSCINQIPPSEVVIQPYPVIVTLPGPILSASCEPVAVGGYAPCSIRGFGLSGGLGHHGLGNQGFRSLGGGYSYQRRGIICD